MINIIIKGEGTKEGRKVVTYFRWSCVREIAKPYLENGK